MDTSTTRPARSPHSAFLRACVLAAVLASTAGCASSGGLVDRGLQAVGLREAKPEGPRTVPLELMAGTNLNAGSRQQGLSLVVKVYRLRGTQRFDRAPFDAFLDETRERAALGDDLIGVDEVVLTPGQRQTLPQDVGDQVNAIGVVALFQAPASQRWRLAFDTRHDAIDRDGVRIGAHACALTTTSASLLTRLPGDAGSLASVRCQP